jgi:hypothetical protein
MLRPRLGFVLVAASLLAVTSAGPSRAADRSDAIPATVGPPGGVGFYFNPDAAGLDPVRVQEILRRSLARWGDTYLGLTAAAPGDDDGLNVIGVAPLPEGLLGLTQSRTPQTTRTIPASTFCARTPGEVSDTVRRSRWSLPALLRRDVVVAGAVRRRTLTRTLRVPRFTRVRAPLSVRVCTLTAATTATTVTAQYDVLLRPSPVSGPWSLGPAFPASPAFDFETNVLHELGHVSGLAHQIDECDPATPMPANQSPAEYWHAVDEWQRPGCAVPAPPAPARTVLTGADSGEPLPGAGGRRAGQRSLVNPRGPAGYDAARFVAVAERAIRRAGGTPGGLTNAAPVPGDRRMVLGFAGLRDGVLAAWGTVARRQSVAAHTVRSCRAARVRVRRPVVLRRTVTSGGLRLRRDVVQTQVRTVSGFACTSRRRAAKTARVAPELDVRVSETAVAWEFGPRLPVDGTRWDLESALLQTLAAASGAPTGGACDTTTPNSSTGLSPGDWWRSRAEVRRSRCLAGSSNREAPAGAPRRDELRAARVG